jgi:urease accessory protein UreH
MNKVETITTLSTKIDFMRLATSVEDWNQMRETLKHLRPNINNLQHVNQIDCSGLIVQVLGKDLPKIHDIERKAAKLLASINEQDED